MTSSFTPPLSSAGIGTKKPKRRYHDDVWLFDVATETWSQPRPGIVNKEGVRLAEWEHCPGPRGSHGACLVEAVLPERLPPLGDEPDADDLEAVEAFEAAKARVPEPPRLHRCLYIFGGYGEASDGIMFGRTDYNDLHALDLDTWEWEVLACAGEVPEERSACQLAFVPKVAPPNEPATSPRLYLTGGWNMIQQFQDVMVLDLETLVWTTSKNCSGDKWSETPPLF